MKKIIVIILCSLLYNCSNSQQNDDFDLFLNNFKACNFPINPADIFYSLDKEWEHYISKEDFDTFLRKVSDSIWVFDKDHQYVFGGKFDVNPEILSIFYRRVYFANKIENEIAEIVLCTLNHNGELIYSLPIAGGYGDSVTVSSIIHSSKDIEVNYIKYEKETVIKTSKLFEIKETGDIKIIE